MPQKKKSTYLGLNDHHRISWDDQYNRVCVVLANLGFSIETIASHTGLTRPQVIYRCRKRGLSVMDYRNGNSTRAMTLLNKYGIQKTKSRTA